MREREVYREKERQVEEVALKVSFKSSDSASTIQLKLDKEACIGMLGHFARSRASSE